MPFDSKAQSSKCYALKGKGQNGSWDCSEWSHVTNYKKLPEKVTTPKEAAPGPGRYRFLPPSHG